MLESAPTVREGLQEVAQLDAAELARTVVFAIEDRKGEDIVMMDLRELTPIADYFVIATADNERLLRALVRTVEEEVAEQHNMKPYHSEGNPESGWILLDYSWVMVHLFSRQQRAFYHLDELWDDAPVVLRIQ
ncbi:MAG: ribosome silencing factor [Chloroflexota bacterium]|nr:ribosome silencing factor [Chloroflexota bacterium]